MLISLRIFFARALVRVAIAAAPEAASARLQAAVGPVWEALRGGGGPTKPVVPK